MHALDVFDNVSTVSHMREQMEHAEASAPNCSTTAVSWLSATRLDRGSQRRVDVDYDDSCLDGGGAGSHGLVPTLHSDEPRRTAAAVSHGQSSRSVAEIFARLDRSHSGTIGQAELVQPLKKLGVSESSKSRPDVDRVMWSDSVMQAEVELSRVLL